MKKLAIALLLTFSSTLMGATISGEVYRLDEAGKPVKLADSMVAAVSTENFKKIESFFAEISEQKEVKEAEAKYKQVLKMATELSPEVLNTLQLADPEKERKIIFYFYLQQIAVARSTTDSAGEFQIAVPEGDHVIVVFNVSAIYGDTYFLGWIRNPELRLSLSAARSDFQYKANGPQSQTIAKNVKEFLTK
jgi:hypothetical protein